MWLQPNKVETVRGSSSDHERGNLSVRNIPPDCTIHYYLHVEVARVVYTNSFQRWEPRSSHLVGTFCIDRYVCQQWKWLPLNTLTWITDVRCGYDFFFSIFRATLCSTFYRKIISNVHKRTPFKIIVNGERYEKIRCNLYFRYNVIILFNRFHRSLKSISVIYSHPSTVYSQRDQICNNWRESLRDT